MNEHFLITFWWFKYMSRLAFSVLFLQQWLLFYRVYTYGIIILYRNFSNYFTPVFMKNITETALLKRTRLKNLLFLKNDLNKINNIMLIYHYMLKIKKYTRNHTLKFYIYTKFFLYLLKNHILETRDEWYNWQLAKFSDQHWFMYSIKHPDLKSRRFNFNIFSRWF